MTNYKDEGIAVKLFMWTVALLGCGVFTWTAINTDPQVIDLKFLFVAVLTITLSSRIVVDVQAIKSNFSVSDIFLLFTALVFGYNAAILLGTIEALSTSIRFTKRLRFRVFNAGTMAVSLFSATLLSEAIFHRTGNLALVRFTQEDIGSIAVLVVVHYLVNTSIIAIANSLRSDRSFWSVWKESYLWMSLTSLANGSIAVCLVIIVNSISFAAIVLGLPIMAVVYFSFRNYRGQLESTIEQAEQAKRHLAEMEVSAAKFKGAFGEAPIGMALLPRQGSWLQVNKSLCNILGVTEQELLTRDYQDYFDPIDGAALRARLMSVLSGEIESFSMEAQLLNAHGRKIWGLVSGSSIATDFDEDSCLILQIQDIEERKEAEEKLTRAAYFDSLTELPNRAYFTERLDHSLNKAKNNSDYRFAVVLADLDRFKLVNDSMGHTAGDELLKAVAQRFQRCLGSPHTISRLSGDEFAFLLENVRDSLNVAEILNFLQKQFAISFDLRGHEMFINLSMGVAVFEPTCGSGEDLLCKADMALHEAKAQGKARHITFDDAMHAKATRRLKIESELRSAVRNGQLFLVYQPIVSTLDRHLIGFEALARWKHPEFGLISPTDFIPIAEETGDIVEIGEFVLNMACSQLAEWQKKIEKASRLQMSVNVSARQLAQGNLFEFVDQVIERTEILPSMLKLEVTETSIVDNVDRAITYLRQLRLLGVSISMDDFGTGYSSLSYLHRLPITTLKIDRSFVNNMETRRQSAEIVHTIILMAKNLGFNVIAEGVENLAQLEKLIEFGCEYAQGYFFSKPLSVMDAEAAIEKSDDDFCATFLPGRILQVDAERYLSS